MAIKDWNGFKKSGDTYIPNDATARAGVSATVDLMKDTTGWIGGNELKNVLTSKTLSNVDVTVNDNKTVNLNGTASANITSLFINTHINLKAGKYYLSGNPEGITGNEYGLRISNASYSINTFFEQGKVLELAQDMTDLRVDIRVPSGTVCNNTLFKPMILTEEQYKLNPSYRPYHSNVVNTLREAEVIEGKNLIPYPYYDKGNKTDAAIKFIDNGNGTITVKAGTATGNNAQYFIVGKGSVAYADVEELRGKILSSGVSTDTNVYLRVWYYDASKNYLTFVNATEEGILLDIPANAVYYVLVLRIENNTTVQSDTVVKPMLRLATETDPTYEPYYIPLKDSKADKTEVQTSISLLNDTVGWVGLNKLNAKFKNSDAPNIVVTPHYDANGLLEYVNLNGNNPDGEKILIQFAARLDGDLILPNGNYKFSIGVSNENIKLQVGRNSSGPTSGSFVLLATSSYGDSELSFTQDQPYGLTVQIFAKANSTFDNVKVYPMVCTTEQYDLNPTYRPYHGSVDEVKADKSSVISALDDSVGWLGGNEADSSKGTTSGTNIFTYNSSDKTVTANGTGDPNNSQYSIPLDVSGDFYFLGCPDGGAVNKYDIYLYDNTTGARVKQWDGVTQSLSNYGNTPCQAKIPEGHNVVMTLRVFAGYEVDNLVFSPMLITKEDYELSPSYRPYHESVEEMLAYSSELLTTENTNIAIDTGAIYKWGRVVNLFLMFKCTTTTPNTDEVLFTLPAKYRPSTTRIFRTYDVGTSATSERHQITIDSSGVCTLKILDTHDAGRWIRFEETFISAS